MMQNKWFKLFVWFLTTFFFFLASSVLISIFSPGPSESVVMKFTESMMSSMGNSLMGVSMSIESNPSLVSIIAISTYMFIPIIIFSILVGFGIRRYRVMNENV